MDPLLAPFLALSAGLVCLLVKQSSFRGKEVLLPRHHGHGLAHQESSLTISEPLFQDKLLAKSRQWREEQSPEAAVGAVGSSFHPRVPQIF